MWLVFLFFLFLSVIIFSSIEISLDNVYISKKYINFKVIIFFKFFYFFKFMLTKVNQSKIENFQNKILDKNFILKKDFKNICKILRDLDVKIKKANFYLRIGLLDIGLTNIVIVLFSSIFPVFIKDKINNKNYNYKVFPNYNDFLVDMNGKIVFSIRIITLIKYYFKNIKSQITHNKVKNYSVKEIF